MRSVPRSKKGSSSSPVRKNAGPGPESSQSARKPRKRSKPRAKKSRGSGGAKERDYHTKPWHQANDNAQRRHTKGRAGALRRLAVAPEQLRGLPSITHLLEEAHGGLPTVLAALRISDDDDAQRFLDRYEHVSVSDRQHVSLEEICVAAQVAPKRLLELAVSALVEDGQSAGRIVAATYHAKVIRTTAQAALDPVYGHQDRKLFLSGTQFMPQAPNRTGGVFNPTVIVNAQMNNMQLPNGQVSAEDEATFRFNAAEEDLRSLHETIDGARLLEAPKSVESPSNVQIGHIYSDLEKAMDCVPTSEAKKRDQEKRL